VPRAHTDYIVFDLETTGLDPTQDRIVQIAALKVSAGQPVAFENWYINPGDQEIPHTVQITLGMDREPSIAAKIRQAPSPEQILPQFLAFIGDLPLVAHNARFDAGFLRSALHQASLADPPLTNHTIDSM
jgi:DNA polymerase-3 subunit alpha (Gram-positive type)